jgi:hypothetical protein
VAGDVMGGIMAFFWRQGLLSPKQSKTTSARRGRSIVNDYDRLWLLACENKGDYPTEKRDAKKEIEYDNSRSVRTFLLMAMIVRRK